MSQMNQYVSELYESSGGNVNVELDLSNHATKASLKGATDIYTSMLASNIFGSFENQSR